MSVTQLRLNLRGQDSAIPRVVQGQRSVGARHIFAAHMDRHPKARAVRPGHDRVPVVCDLNFERLVDEFGTHPSVLHHGESPAAPGTERLKGPFRTFLPREQVFSSSIIPRACDGLLEKWMKTASLALQPEAEAA